MEKSKQQQGQWNNEDLKFTEKIKISERHVSILN